MWRVTVLLAALGVVGCRTTRPDFTVRPFVGSDGGRHYWIECRDSKGKCLSIAGQLCPGGFAVSDGGSQLSAEARSFAWGSVRSARSDVRTTNAIDVQCTGGATSAAPLAEAPELPIDADENLAIPRDAGAGQ